MRIGMDITGTESAGSRRTSFERNKRLSNMDYAQTMTEKNTAWMTEGSRLRDMAGPDTDEKSASESGEIGETGTKSSARSEAEKIYQAVASGGQNPVKDIRQASKVPYGHLAEGGVITYNGVTFVCDERSNSICLGNMDDKKNVLTITLSGGGHLKVHRDNLGDLARAVGMFSPEDLNRIMRAIAQDTKIQSMQKEIDDMEANVGNQIGDGAAETSEKKSEEV